MEKMLRKMLDATQSALLAMSANAQAVLAEMGWQTDNNRTIGRHGSHRKRKQEARRSPLFRSFLAESSKNPAQAPRQEALVADRNAAAEFLAVGEGGGGGDSW